MRLGGMSRTEQITLARAYSKSGKGGVFEWGLDSSTFIADFLKVSRLCAVDSDPVWVQKLRYTLDFHRNYKILHADIGPVRSWGQPLNKSQKHKWPDYSTMVDTEAGSFGVYLVDGRFRVACACRALLHADSDSRIIVHDFSRQQYHVLLRVSEQVSRTEELVVLKKRPSVSDTEIMQMWEQYKFEKG